MLKWIVAVSGACAGGTAMVLADSGPIWMPCLYACAEYSPWVAWLLWGCTCG